MNDKTVKILIGEGNYTRIIFDDDSFFISGYTISKVIDRCDGLLRISKGVAINPSFGKLVDKYYEIDKIHYKISRRRVIDVNRSLGEYRMIN
jgi:hypothetical protein